MSKSFMCLSSSSLALVEDKLRVLSCPKRMFFLGRQSPFVVLVSDGICPCCFGMLSSYGLVDPQEERMFRQGFEPFAV